jgi:hypothetical protein
LSEQAGKERKSFLMSKYADIYLRPIFDVAVLVGLPSKDDASVGREMLL